MYDSSSSSSNSSSSLSYHEGWMFVREGVMHMDREMFIRMRFLPRDGRTVAPCACLKRKVVDSFFYYLFTRQHSRDLNIMEPSIILVLQTIITK